MLPTLVRCLCFSKSSGSTWWLFLLPCTIMPLCDRRAFTRHHYVVNKHYTRSSNNSINESYLLNPLHTSAHLNRWLLDTETFRSSLTFHCSYPPIWLKCTFFQKWSWTFFLIFSSFRYHNLKNIARIANAVQCHSCLSGNKDCHEIRFSIVRIVISISIVTSLWDWFRNSN